MDEQRFNSRPLEEVDHKWAGKIHPTVGVSIHDLSKRSTNSSNNSKPDSRSFNSRPLEEVDRRCAGRECKPDVSIHDLSKRSTCARSGSRKDHLSFQFTTSRRGRPLDDSPSAQTTSFQFTTSRRGRPIFQKTLQVQAARFNSRPLEEVDRSMSLHFTEEEYVSIHDLSKRSTRVRRAFQQARRVSIHDLSKRSTVLARNLFRNT